MVEKTLEQTCVCSNVYAYVAKTWTSSNDRLVLSLRCPEPVGGSKVCCVNTTGNEDRVTLLPEQLVPILHEHLRHVKTLTKTQIGDLTCLCRLQYNRSGL